MNKEQRDEAKMKGGENEKEQSQRHTTRLHRGLVDRGRLGCWLVPSATPS